jgi:hypothetical protein
MTARFMRLAALLLCFAVGLWAADPWLGTWKLNVAKSKFSPGPPPKSRVRTFEMAGDQLKSTVENVNAEGQTGRTVWIGKKDGKEYPVEGPPMKVTFSVRQISPTAQEWVAKREGKPAYTSRLVLSKDGRTITQTVKGTQDGKPFENISVHEKQ